MRESKIEGDSCEYARKKGWYERKYTTPGRKSAPDRIFIKCGQVLFIEFKATGKKATELQKKHHEKLRDQKMVVFVSDDIDDAKMILDIYDPTH